MLYPSDPHGTQVYHREQCMFGHLWTSSTTTATNIAIFHGTARSVSMWRWNRWSVHQETITLSEFTADASFARIVSWRTSASTPARKWTGRICSSISWRGLPSHSSGMYLNLHSIWRGEVYTFRNYWHHDDRISWNGTWIIAYESVWRWSSSRSVGPCSQAMARTTGSQS